MTQEEKAKAYDEALERARANYKADKEMGFLENCNMLELIFPELAESEDERIRKALINLVCTVGEYYLPKLEARNKMLDYLEKQKEQKPEWSEEDKEALDMCLDAIPKAWKTKSGILLTKWLRDKLNSM